MYFVRDVFALKKSFSIATLEQGLVYVEALHKRLDGADGHVLVAPFRRNYQRARCGNREVCHNGKERWSR